MNKLFFHFGASVALKFPINEINASPGGGAIKINLPGCMDRKIKIGKELDAF
jgi:hypothetical protein